MGRGRSKYPSKFAKDQRTTAPVRKPAEPGLKEEALQGFKVMSQFVLDEWHGCADYEKFKKITDTVQQALEQLDD